DPFLHCFLRGAPGQKEPAYAGAALRPGRRAGGNQNDHLADRQRPVPRAQPVGRVHHVYLQGRTVDVRGQYVLLDGGTGARIVHGQFGLLVPALFPLRKRRLEVEL
ncbi:MAG: hypothetical protein AVDCRST_MAG56-4673, partial [uncultured Cytophagales bacterium]